MVRVGESDLSRMGRQNLGKDHSDEPFEFEPDSDTGSDPKPGFRMWPDSELDRDLRDKLHFDSKDLYDSDDDDESIPELDYTHTDLVDDSVVNRPTSPPTSPLTSPLTRPLTIPSRKNAFLDDWEGSWVGDESPPSRPWLGGPPRLYAGESPPGWAGGSGFEDNSSFLFSTGDIPPSSG